MRAFCLVVFFAALFLRILASALDTGAATAAPVPASAAKVMTVQR